MLSVSRRLISPSEVLCVSAIPTDSKELQSRDPCFLILYTLTLDGGNACMHGPIALLMRVRPSRTFVLHRIGHGSLLFDPTQSGPSSHRRIPTWPKNIKFRPTRPIATVQNGSYIHMGGSTLGQGALPQIHLLPLPKLR